MLSFLTEWGVLLAATLSVIGFTVLALLMRLRTSRPKPMIEKADEILSERLCGCQEPCETHLYQIREPGEG